MRYIKLFENFDTNSIDEICKKYKIQNYTINEDGTIDVDGNVDLSNNSLLSIPLKFGKVSGDFHCSYNKLTSLDGCPSYVGGDFGCIANDLTSLEGCPKYVDKVFGCFSNFNLNTLLGLDCEINMRFAAPKKLQIIYDILKDVDYISNFYEYGIISDIDSPKPNLNKKRLLKFIRNNNLDELTLDQILELDKYYNFI